MKKIIIPFLIFFSLFIVGSSVLAANSITSRLKGRLLLQVQDKGRIWYVDPVGLQKHEVTFANALSLFQRFALGITNADLLKIPADTDSIDPNLDTDNDGYPDRTELQNGYSPYIPGSNQGRFKTDNNLAKRLKGRLLLQVEQGGAIWYVDINGKRHNVRWGNLMSLFRRLALGITDKDLAIVGNIDTVNWQTYKNSEYGYEIKYPNEWRVIREGLPVEQVRIVSWSKEQERPVGGLPINTAMLNVIIRKDTNIDEFYHILLQDFREGYTKLISDNKLTVDGYPSRKLVYFSEVEGNSYVVNYLIQKDKTTYDLTMALSKFSDILAESKFRRIFDQIPSTFKFLD